MKTVFCLFDCLSSIKQRLQGTPETEGGKKGVALFLYSLLNSMSGLTQVSLNGGQLRLNVEFCNYPGRFLAAAAGAVHLAMGVHDPRFTWDCSQALSAQSSDCSERGRLLSHLQALLKTGLVDFSWGPCFLKTTLVKNPPTLWISRNGFLQRASLLPGTQIRLQDDLLFICNKPDTPSKFQMFVS